MAYWLMKTEPDAFSFEELVESPKRTACWDGIRNYQARNLMRDDFKKGDGIFIYHSRIAEPAIVGIAEVVREAYPDHTALDPNEKYYDPKSAEKGESRWCMVDVKATHRLKNHVTLKQIREEPALADMMVIRKGARLSIQPVAAAEWKHLKQLGKPSVIR